MRLKINSDVYGISKRIKYIDKNYYIVYNTSTGNFEVHNSAQIGTSYCLTLPFSALDERTLNYVHQTKSANIDNILANIENANKLRENAEKRSVLSQFNDAISDEFIEQ